MENARSFSARVRNKNRLFTIAASSEYCTDDPTIKRNKNNVRIAKGETADV